MVGVVVLVVSAAEVVEEVGTSSCKARPSSLTSHRTGVNFTNILQAAFSYKNVFGSFSPVTVWLCNFVA